MTAVWTQWKRRHISSFSCCFGNDICTALKNKQTKKTNPHTFMSKYDFFFTFYVNEALVLKLEPVITKKNKYWNSFRYRLYIAQRSFKDGFRSPDLFLKHFDNILWTSISKNIIHYMILYAEGIKVLQPRYCTIPFLKSSFKCRERLIHLCPRLWPWY